MANETKLYDYYTESKLHFPQTSNQISSDKQVISHNIIKLSFPQTKFYPTNK